MSLTLHIVNPLCNSHPLSSMKVGDIHTHTYTHHIHTHTHIHTHIHTYTHIFDHAYLLLLFHRDLEGHSCCSVDVLTMNIFQKSKSKKLEIYIYLYIYLYIG